MGRSILVALLVAEGVILALLFLLLLIWPVFLRVAEARRTRQRTDVLAAVRARRPGGGVADVEAALARCHPEVLLQVLETFEEDGKETDGLDLERLVHDTSAFRRIERAAESPFWWRRQRAARLLSRVGRPDQDRPLLLALVRDPHPGVSTVACMAARRLGWPGLVEPVLDQAVEEGRGHRGKDDLVREILVGLDADVVPSLRRRLETTTTSTREVVLLRIAGRLGDDRLLPLVVDRLRNGGLEVRIQAAKTAAAIGDPAAAGALRTALEDAAWQVRTQAAHALGELGVGDAADDLRRVLSDPSWWVRLRAALSLRRLGPAGPEILASVEPEEDRYASDMADYVLGLDEGALREYVR